MVTEELAVRLLRSEDGEEPAENLEAGLPPDSRLATDDDPGNDRFSPRPGATVNCKLKLHGVIKKISFKHKNNP
jgi:hypothetical protein